MECPGSQKTGYCYSFQDDPKALELTNLTEDTNPEVALINNEKTAGDRNSAQRLGASIIFLGFALISINWKIFKFILNLLRVFLN